MLKQEFRPMTVQEKEVMKGLVYGKPESVADKFIRGFIVLIGSPMAGLLIAAAIGMVGERLGFLKSRSSVITFLKLSTILGFIFGIIMLTKDRTGKKKVNKEYENDLKDGNVMVLSCQSNAVIEVEEFEDEGPGFFFEIDDGKIMFLQGQYLYDHVDSKRFPNKKFDVVKLPHSGVILDVVCKGDSLAPLRVLEPTAISSEQHIPFVYDGDIFSGKLETIEQDIRQSKKDH